MLSTGLTSVQSRASLMVLQAQLGVTPETKAIITTDDYLVGLKKKTKYNNWDKIFKKEEEIIKFKI